MVQDDPWAAAGVREGDVLAEKYRVERVLGVGGMGVVVSARHVQLEERVAIKFLLPHMLTEPSAVQRFLREAKAAVRIKNEHVVRVFDVGTLPTGAPYMVMEFLDGGDLAAWIQTRGALPVEQAVDFVLQACVALADAHSMGIIHRDLKPSNLFCVRRSDGQLVIKVLDFGISKVLDAGSDGGMSMTKTSTVMGSPLYMSPEQMRSSKDVDARTDIWALGVILYELLAGAPPFDGTTLTEVAVKVATEPPPPFHTVRGDIPPALESALAGCLQKDPRARYAHVGQFAAAIAPFGSVRGRGSLERIAGVFASAETPPTTPSPMRAPSSGQNTPYVVADTGAPVGRTAGPRASGSTPVAGVAIGIAAVLLLSVGGWAALRGGKTPSVPAAPPPVASAPPSAPPPMVSIAPLAESPAVPLPLPLPTSLPGAAAGGTGASSGSPVVSHAEGKHRPGGAASRDAGAASGVTPAPASPVAPPPSPAANCNPPYFIDAAGHRQYKPECL